MKPGAPDAGSARDPATGVSEEIGRALEAHVANAYLMLFDDRFTVILDDDGRFQKSFDIGTWLGRFGDNDAAQLVALKEKIEQRLSELFD
jgi:hypothetical protein